MSAFKNKLLLIEAWLLLWLLRIALWIVPFRAWRRLIDIQHAPSGLTIPRRTIRQVTGAVQRMQRYVIDASCLVQALAVQRMLSWRRQTSNLKIGVLQGAGGSLEAHAWVQIEKYVVIGSRPDLAAYGVLSLTEPDHSSMD